MRGYWDEPERTREAIDAAGWMHSGDLATLDSAGYCNIVGRIKDMLIRGGENVYPREIEEFVASASQDPGGAGLRRPRPAAGRGGVRLDRAQARRDGERARRSVPGARGRIAHYKVPRHIRLVPEFPATATGKPQKFAMREAMMRELGVSAALSA